MAGLSAESSKFDALISFRAYVGLAGTPECGMVPEFRARTIEACPESPVLISQAGPLEAPEEREVCPITVPWRLFVHHILPLNPRHEA